MYLVLFLPSGLSVDIGSPKQSVRPCQEAECASLLVFPAFPGVITYKISHTLGWDRFLVQRQVKGVCWSPPLVGGFGFPVLSDRR